MTEGIDSNSPDTEVQGDLSIGRRRALTLAAAAGAAGAASLIAGTGTASANTEGESLTLGDVNSATSNTVVEVDTGLLGLEGYVLPEGFPAAGLPDTAGVVGVDNSAVDFSFSIGACGVAGVSTNNTGVYAGSTNGNALLANAAGDGSGVRAVSTNGAAVLGLTKGVGAAGVQGVAQDGYHEGFLGLSNAYGVAGYSKGSAGPPAQPDSAGVLGFDTQTGGGIGVAGVSGAGTGVSGNGLVIGVSGTGGTGGTGVYGTAGTGGVGVSALGPTGVGGTSNDPSGAGVSGYAADGSTYGNVGDSNGYGVSGYSGSGTVPTLPAAAGVLGVDSAASGGIAVAALSDTGTGVSAKGAVIGVSGASVDGIAVQADSPFGTALAVQGIANFSRSGLVKVPAHRRSVKVTSAPVTSASLVLATPQGGGHAGVYVQGVSRSGSAFTIELNKTTKKALEIAWFVIG